MNAVFDRPAQRPSGKIGAREVIETRRDERNHAWEVTKAVERGKPSRARLLAFYSLTGVTGITLSALGLSSAAWPWYAPTQLFFGMPVEPHRWHGAEFAALLAVLLGGALLSLLWRPARRPLLAQYLLVSGALIAVLFEVFAGPRALALALPFTGIAALYPDRAALLDLRMRERRSLPLIALSAGAMALLIQPTYLALSYQILYPLSEHATHDHWVAAAALAIVLSAGGLLAATHRPGWRILAALVGVAYTYLGFAAIVTDTYAGSWGVEGGVVAAVAGALYLALALFPGRRLAWYASEADE